MWGEIFQTNLNNNRKSQFNVHLLQLISNSISQWTIMRMCLHWTESMKVDESNIVDKRTKNHFLPNLNLEFDLIYYSLFTIWLNIPYWNCSRFWHFFEILFNSLANFWLFSFPIESIQLHVALHDFIMDMHLLLRLTPNLHTNWLVWLADFEKKDFRFREAQDRNPLGILFESNGCNLYCCVDFLCFGIRYAQQISFMFTIEKCSLFFVLVFSIRSVFHDGYAIFV